MLLAFSSDGVPTEATKGGRSTCPCCHATVIAKCGELKIWHWAHESVLDCDPWYHGISPWHLSWQSIVPVDQREVVINGKHRADIVSQDGTVFEIQNSPLSPDDVRDREKFYGNMIWVLSSNLFDAVLCDEPIINGGDVLIDTTNHTYMRVTKHKKFISCMTKPILAQLNDGTIVSLLYEDDEMDHRAVGVRISVEVRDMLLVYGPTSIDRAYVPVPLSADRLSFFRTIGPAEAADRRLMQLLSRAGYPPRTDSGESLFPTHYRRRSDGVCIPVYATRENWELVRS